MCYAGTEKDHIKQSHGGETNVLNHYATCYATSYGQHWSLFKPKDVSFYGSGYTSNIRPVLQYNSRLDDLDNPTFKELLKTNYVTTTHNDYLPWEFPTGKESFPSVNPLIAEENHDILFSKFRDVFTDQRLQDNVVSVIPKHKPFLSSLKSKASSDEENYGHGPVSNKSTYTSHYTPQISKQYDLSRRNIGPKENSGNTENIKNEDTLTGRINSYCNMSQIRWKTDRPFGQTVYKQDYNPYQYKDGSESLPPIANNSMNKQPNIYVNANKVWPDYSPVYLKNNQIYDLRESIPEEKLEKLRKQDPAEYQNVIHGFKEPSMSKGMHPDMRNHPKSHAELLGNQTHGPPTRSGASLNVQGNIQTRDMPPDRFVTHYMTRYYPPPPGKNIEDTEGHVHFNTQPSRVTAISNDIHLSKFESQQPAIEKLESLPSYQSRSLQARDCITLPPTKNI